jgi:hypothetical protein
MDGPELSAVIADLRASLQKAKEEGDGKDLRFSVEDVEVEFQVAVTREAGGKFGLKVYVFDAHADGKQSQAFTQKVKLKMKVVETAPPPDAARRKLRRAMLGGATADPLSEGEAT